MDILWAVLLMAGLAVILALLIVLFSHIFHVEEDPRIAAVEKMLPNYNCGACGYAGCHDLAEALVNGEVKKVRGCEGGRRGRGWGGVAAYLNSTPGPDGKSLHVNP